MQIQAVFSSCKRRLKLATPTRFWESEAVRGSRAFAAPYSGWCVPHSRLFTAPFHNSRGRFNLLMCLVESAQAITPIGCSHYRCLLVRTVIATRRLKYLRCVRSGRRRRRRRRSWRKSRDAFGTRSLVSGGCVAALSIHEENSISIYGLFPFSASSLLWKLGIMNKEGQVKTEHFTIYYFNSLHQSRTHFNINKPEKPRADDFLALSVKHFKVKQNDNPYI